MQWSEFYTSSIGQKLVMASTGLFLLAFLVIHLSLNATMLVADGGLLFNKTATVLQQSWWLHCLEILVFSSLILHIGQGLRLAWHNRSKRSTTYAVSPPPTPDAAKFMGVLGLMILVFLLLHLYQFWLPHTISNPAAKVDLYQLVRSTLQQGWVVLVYGLGCGAVAAHLSHGWRSAAITLGLGLDKTTQLDRPLLKLLSILGMSCALLVPLGLAAIPIFIFTMAHA